MSVNKDKELEMVGIIFECVKKMVKEVIPNAAFEKINSNPYPKLLLKHTNDRQMGSAKDIIKQMSIPVYFDESEIKKGRLKICIDTRKIGLYIFSNLEILTTSPMNLFIKNIQGSIQNETGGSPESTVLAASITGTVNQAPDYSKQEKSIKELIFKCGAKRVNGGTGPNYGHFHTFRKFENTTGLFIMSLYCTSLDFASVFEKFFVGLGCKVEVGGKELTVLKITLDPAVDYSLLYNDEFKNYFPPIQVPVRAVQQSQAVTTEAQVDSGSLPLNVVPIKQLYDLLSIDDKDSFLKSIGLDQKSSDQKARDARLNLLATLNKQFSQDGEYRIVKKGTQPVLDDNGFTIPFVPFTQITG